MLAYDRENKNKIDYDVYDVGNWLEDLTQDDINDLINSMMQSKILGNKLNAGMEREQKKSLPKTTTGKQ